MKMRIFLLIVVALFINGCVQVPFEITNFVPYNNRAKAVPSFIQSLDIFPVHSDPEFDVSCNILEFNNILAALVSIKNKTGDVLPAEDYSIALFDGRDLKTVKMMARQDMLNLKTKYSGGSSGAIQDQLIGATMDNALKVANVPTKDKIIGLIDLGIYNYFSFRPIYPGEVRQGVLCFLPDFRLEYPLTLAIEIKSKEIDTYFIPEVKKK